MASISITKPPLAPPSHPPSSLNKSLFPQTSQLSLSKTNRFSPRRSKLTVSATAINEAQNNGGNHHNRAVVDRRNMLLTLGGAAITSVSSPSLAAPVAPDVLRPCVPTDNTDFNPPGSKGKLCCLDIDKHVPIRDFRFQDYPTVMKTRRAAHRVEWDGQFHRDFKAAIAAMRKLPDNDPCSLYMQSLIHCAYCDAVYKQVNYPDKRFMIHNGWLFYPFHRWELYFFERIAGSLIGKPDFALPFWAWDLEQGMRIPDIYEWDPSSSLYDATRDRTHPSKIVDLNADGVTNRNNLNDQQLIQQNLEAVKKQMTGNNNDINSELFYGGEYKAGDDKTPGAGTIENGAHTGVHVWTGGNMGEFWTAGKDPLFYALHGNVDRLWYVWEKKLKTRNSRHTEKDDYLNASFVFYDENRRPVRVTVRDCLDIEKLGYKYEDMPMPWLGESENQGPGGGGGGGWGPGGGGGGGDWGPGGGDWGPGGGGDWGPGGGGGDWGHGGGGWGGGGGGGDWGHGGGGDWGGGGCGGGGDWGHGGGGGGDWGGGGGGGGGWGGGGWGG